jgi:CO dehydrogenase maturation factor
MATTIAVSGKGGTGKTTLAAMIIRTLMEQTNRPRIFTVDADPNACLGLVLGIEVKKTIADLRESARQKQPTNAGLDRARTFEYGMQEAITEAKGFDLLTMGRPEGPSCYCAVNNMLRKFMDELSGSYDFVVIDNEAGMEHLSRRTTNNVDLLCIVAEPSPVGEITAKRIFDLTKTLPILVKQTGIIWNRADHVKKLEKIENFGCVPYDKTVFDASIQGKTIFDLKKNSPALSAIQKILEQKLNFLKI